MSRPPVSWQDSDGLEHEVTFVQSRVEYTLEDLRRAAGQAPRIRARILAAEAGTLRENPLADLPSEVSS